MRQTEIRDDIASSVENALHARLDRLNEVAMVRRSDALLATLPGAGESQRTTTTTLLRRYHLPLQRELCRGNLPITASAAVEHELRELTRAVLVTVGIREGISIEAAVSIALVLHKRGVARFCALP